jgi:5-methylcytosine-specific restriction endonuclease McrA
MKTCNSCTEEKSFIEFDKKARHSKYPNSSAGYSNICKPCRVVQDKDYYYSRGGREKNLEYKSKNKRLSTLQMQEWRGNNREVYNAYVREWRAKNPEKSKRSSRANSFNRRTKCKKLTSKEIAYILKEGNNTCVYCNQPGHSIDHITPISRGGTNDLSNLVVACKSCNSSKKDKPLITFLWARRGRR